MNTIVLHQELEEAVYKCRKSLRKANKAIRELHLLSDYPTPSTLKDVTSGNLCAFVEQRVKAVEATPIYTEAQKDKAIGDWIEWKIRTMPHVVAVENFVNEWQDVSPVLDTADITILTSDIAESLTHRYIVDVPLQAHRHIELINGVRNTINELRNWECEQDCKKIELKNLLSLTENEIKESWANGTIKINHDYDDDKGVVAWREAKNRAML